MRRYDVVVVGGRVAGASSAMLLARAGLSVALLDRGRRGSDTLSTHALMRGGALQLARWGVLEGLVAAGTPAVRRTVFRYADGEVTDVAIGPRAGVDALYAPRRHLLDRLLVEAAEEAGAHVLHETTVTSLRRGRTGRVAGVVARTRAGARVELAAGLTIGADGLRSRVAEQVGARALRQGRTSSAVLYRYVEDPWGDGYEWAYGDAAGSGLIPTNDGASCLFVATTPGRMRRLRRLGVERAFADLLGETGPAAVERAHDLGTVSPVRGWGGVPGFVRESGGPGWALVGDAGYFKDPITSHGITDALRDAELLAEQVLAAHAGAVAEQVALARYEGTRERLSRQLFEVTERVAAYDWDAPGIRSLLLQFSAAMGDEVEHLESLGRLDVAG
ncbi:NAD(P)/FAD-dependent oxidoreductase [Nocardioides sp. zg-1308]|uniref:FAD-dependent monooxygenase n=1 Tax=Nocardioides renjunii TaxID=3095075 RepID=A0ABU5KCW2_9ACTN|nr:MULTISPECIES: FAD-dependent monooxygenase [unclassified Nocardioides]MDZ5662711.1 FAD-dependent monooxygenase [Nocardioides sp. S-58]NPD05622.1 NAD(P)/FAD-dependent oxidoreductase [Nocardioides sp. zg-1308]